MVNSKKKIMKPNNKIISQKSSKKKKIFNHYSKRIMKGGGTQNVTNILNKISVIIKDYNNYKSKTLSTIFNEHDPSNFIKELYNLNLGSMTAVTPTPNDANAPTATCKQKENVVKKMKEDYYKFKIDVIDDYDDADEDYLSWKKKDNPHIIFGFDASRLQELEGNIWVWATDGGNTGKVDLNDGSNQRKTLNNNDIICIKEHLKSLKRREREIAVAKATATVEAAAAAVAAGKECGKECDEYVEIEVNNQ